MTPMEIVHALYHAGCRLERFGADQLRLVGALPADMTRDDLIAAKEALLFALPLAEWLRRELDVLVAMETSGNGDKPTCRRRRAVWTCRLDVYERLLEGRATPDEARAAAQSARA